MHEDMILQSFYCAHVECPSDCAMKYITHERFFPAHQNSVFLLCFSLYLTFSLICLLTLPLLIFSVAVVEVSG